MGLVTAQAVCQTSRASLAWPLAEFARAGVVDPVMGGWTYVHTSVAQEVHSCMAFETLLAGALALKATWVTLRTYVIQREVVGWTLAYAGVFEVEMELGP